MTDKISISKVYYINLDQRPDRNGHVLHLLEECPWPYERIQAIRLNVTPEQAGYKLASRHQNHPHVASIFLSHRKALAAAATSSGSGSFVVLEDDVMISSKFYKSGLEPLSKLPSTWEIVIISPRYRNKSRRKDDDQKVWVDKPFGYELVASTWARENLIATGAHFYVVRNRCIASSIKSRLDDVVEIEDIDIWLMSNTACYFLQSDFVGTKSILGSNHADKIGS